MVNPFRSAEEEIKFGPRIFRVNDRIMQTKNTEKVSNGDLGFIRYIKDTDQGKKIGIKMNGKLWNCWNRIVRSRESASCFIGMACGCFCQ